VDLKHQEGARAASATTPGDASPGAKWGDESVAQERDLLERALVALRQGDARAALSLTAEHQRRFPSGLLRPERDDVERKALDVLRIKEGGSVQ
jgi:hypothetical protein